MDRLIRNMAIVVIGLIGLGCVIAVVAQELEENRLEQDRERFEVRQRRDEEERRRRARAEDERRDLEHAEARRRREAKKKQAWFGSEKVRAARNALRLDFPGYDDATRRKKVQDGISAYREQRAAERDSIHDLGPRMCLELLLTDLRQRCMVMDTPSKRREMVVLVNRYRSPGERRYTMDDHVRDTKAARADFRIGLYEGYLRELEERGLSRIDKVIETGRP